MQGLPDLPQRLPGQFRDVWLPGLAELVRDEAEWHFRPDGAASWGTARLRVWRAMGGGHFAAVTGGGRGMPVTDASRHIWHVLAGVYCRPFALAEYWPEGAAGEAHADLVVPPPAAAWLRLWPWLPCHPMSVVVGPWWLVNGPDILAP